RVLILKLAAANRPSGDWNDDDYDVLAGGGRCRPHLEGSRGPGNTKADPGRARRKLNADTIREMHRAFREGGRKAIDKVMKQQPAIFLKLLVLLVPRELEVMHSGGVKAMSDEQLERAIEVIEDLIRQRDAGKNAKVIE